MNLHGFGKTISGTALTLALVFGGGTILGTTAQAQDRDDRGRRREIDRRPVQRADRDWHRDRNWDRDRDRRRDWDRDRDRRIVVVPARPYVYPRTYPYYGPYGGYG